MRAHAGPSRRLLGSMLVAGDVEHGADKIDACGERICRFDEAGIDVNDLRSVVAHDHVHRQPAMPVERRDEFGEQQISGIATLSFSAAPPPTPSRKRRQACWATSRPRCATA